jgi:hypothetical protein
MRSAPLPLRCSLSETRSLHLRLLCVDCSVYSFNGRVSELAARTNQTAYNISAAAEGRVDRRSTPVRFRCCRL